MKYGSPIFFGPEYVFFVCLSHVCAKEENILFHVLFYYKRNLLLLVSIQNLTVQNMNELFYIQEAKS